MVVLAQAQVNRTINGTFNNLSNPRWGAVDVMLERVSPVSYKDGVQEINEEGIPLPRVVSTSLFTQVEDILEPMQLSGYVWMFGQFLEHDISYIEESEIEVNDMQVLPSESTFTNGIRVQFSRNISAPGSGTSINNPRNYQNKVSSFIDGSMIYGSTSERAAWLRTFEKGKLKVSKQTIDGQELLPWNTVSGEFNDRVDNSDQVEMVDESGQLLKYFVAGDVRANENVLLLCMHTIFVREHNRICNILANANPSWDDETLYQVARKRVGAYIQSITYNEWLPSVGVNLPEYRGYNPDLNPTIYNEFSAAAFSITQTLANSNIVRMDNSGNDVNEGSLAISNSLYNPLQLLTVGGPDAYLKGMGTQVMQDLDNKMIPELQNHIFENSAELGKDFAAYHIFKGRDRGLVDYNTMRGFFGLPPLVDFSELVDEEEVDILKSLYGEMGQVDAWVGMMSEPRVYDDALFGELVMAIFRDQFRVLRDADRYYYEIDASFTTEELEDIRTTTLHDIIVRNTGIDLMQESVFVALQHIDIPNLVIPENHLEALAFPNPISTSTLIKIHSDEEVSMKYSLIGTNGQLIYSAEHLLHEGHDNYLTLPLDISSTLGYYKLVLSTPNAQNTIKLLKVR